MAIIGPDFQRRLGRSDIKDVIGAAVASALSAFAYLYSIGLVPVFTFIAGMFFTMWAQERFEMKRRKQEFDRKMTEYIYGPLHQEVSSFLKDLEGFQSSLGPVDRNSTLAIFMKDYRYGFAEKEIRDKAEDLQKMLLPYATLFNEARNKTLSLIKEGLIKSGIDQSVRFSILDSEKRSLGQSIEIIEPIFKDKTPWQFIAEQPVPYRNITIEIYIGYHPESVELFSKDHKIEQLSKEVLEKVRDDSLVEEYRQQRSLLMEKCVLLLGLIRTEITLS